MLGIRYSVQPGDTLWGLAGRFFGDPAKWPLIHEHNNSAQAMAATGCRIADPNLIFVGQVIYIPDQRPQAIPTSSSPQSSPSGAMPRHPDSFPKARREVRGIPFRYDLDKLPSITVASAGCLASVKLSGSVTIQPRKPYTFLEISQQGFEIQAKRRSDLVLGKLLSDSKVRWRPSTQEVSFENGIAACSQHQPAPVPAKAAGFSSRTKQPVLKARLRHSSLTGELDDHIFAAQSLEAEIVIMPKHFPPQPGSAAPPRSASDPSGWDCLVGDSSQSDEVLLVAAIVGDICAAGMRGGPARFAEASPMLSPGMRLAANVRGVAPLRIAGARTSSRLQPQALQVN